MLFSFLQHLSAIASLNQPPLSPIEECNKRSTAFEKSYPKYAQHGGLGGSFHEDVVTTCLSPAYNACVAILHKSSTTDSSPTENYLEILDLKTKHQLSQIMASSTAPLEQAALHASKEYMGLQDDIKRVTESACN